jgi:hypothetical protein
MADKPAPKPAAAKCCEKPVTTNHGDKLRRCLGCGAEWTRASDAEEWKLSPAKVVEKKPV